MKTVPIVSENELRNSLALFLMTWPITTFSVAKIRLLTCKEFSDRRWTKKNNVYNVALL